jgi:uncharacterized protein YbbC (DUF1343 family)
MVDSLTVINGVDVLLEKPDDYLGGEHIGLVTNPTGITSKLESTLDAFWRNPRINLKAVFGPEHGARGDVQDALHVKTHEDECTGLPVYSLYGENCKPTSDMLDGLDSLVFDIQDCGARFYTYISTLNYCMEACNEEGLTMVVLDRPNPINGNRVEGSVLEEGFESFIGLHRVPIRHGFTIGEMAGFINREIRCSLRIVEMRGWSRWMWFDDTGLIWVQPSPNLPHLDTATVYPGTCLFEGVNISEGRGTTRPFELIGAPGINGKEWAEFLNNLELSGVRFRSCFFTPTFWRFKDQQCGGVQVHVVDRESFEPVRTGLYMISSMMSIFPEFMFNEATYDKRLHFDLLAGTDGIRKSLQEREPVESIIKNLSGMLTRFKKEREKYLLYGEVNSN